MASPPPDDERRFEFGENWHHFLRVLTPARIATAEASLVDMLGTPSLAGHRFLDIGSGSGLFSLAARRLGATVYSFDFDPQSVACTGELRRRYTTGEDGAWTISRGSVLDAQFMATLGIFDVVYSWGVLHHTGAMWSAVEQACRSVAPNGRLFIALYNDQGVKSEWWRRIKRTYNDLSPGLRRPYLLALACVLETGAIAVALARGEPKRFVERWTAYDSVRGMSRWHDTIDWIGGYPFEVATPEAVFDFCSARGYRLSRLRTCGGKMGCNEFVFVRA